MTKNMNKQDYASALGIKSPYQVKGGVRGEEGNSLAYCKYDIQSNMFFIHLPYGNPKDVLHELGHIKAHESGFPIICRTFRNNESASESQILDSSNGALMDSFGHPLVYSFIADFKSSDEWYGELERPIHSFMQVIRHYGAEDISGMEREASFAVAHMALQTAEVLLSSAKYLPKNIPQVIKCMEQLNDLSQKGLRLKKGFWEKTTGILEPYYSRNSSGYTANMADDVREIGELIVPENLGIRLYTESNPYMPASFRPVPDVEIPNWIIDYYPR